MKFEPNLILIHLILGKIISSHVHEDLLGLCHRFTLVIFKPYVIRVVTLVMSSFCHEPL
jgi:hypothetical protein